jgi:hypothetical protein
VGIQRTYSDGSVLVSTALTIDDMGQIMQPIIQDMLGYPIDSDAQNVRTTWPTEGAPYQNKDDDVTYLRFTLKDDPYDKIRDEFNWSPAGYGNSPFGSAPYGGDLSGGFGVEPFGEGPFGEGEEATVLTQQVNYTRVWKVHVVAYGPNSFDNLRAIRSGVYNDLFTNQLAQKQLFPMSEFEEVIRNPEHIGSIWWERCDFSFEMYEFVTEQTTKQTVVSVEVIVEEAQGVIADVTVQAPN